MLKNMCATNILIAIVILISLFIIPGNVSAQGTRPEANWAGNWSTRWTIMQYGQMKTYAFDLTISQSGNQVNGSSTYYNWTISGTVSGNTLTGRWSNAMSPQEAGHVFGPFRLTMDASGNSFSGQFIGEYHYNNWDPRFTVVGQRAGVVPVTPPVPQPPYVPPVTPQQPYQPSSLVSKQFTGKWNTNFGDLNLIQDGDKLTGTYYNGEGKIEGTVSGDTATGTWSEPRTYQPPYDAGDFIFTLSSSGMAIDGKWRYGSCEWDGDIRGTRKVQPAPMPIPTPAPIPIPQPPVPSGPWSGVWDTGQWGKMTLTQNGNVVSGDYTHDQGKISGTVSGNMLVGKWSESPSYSPPNDAGDMEFTLAADGKSFSGRWRYGNSGSWHSWSGNLLSQASSKVLGTCDWTGTWNFDWSREMKLQQTGSQVTGTYIPGGWTYTATISGTVSGNLLSGTWTEKDRSGRFEFTMLADCNSFTGRYNHNISSSTYGYNLHDLGRRVSPVTPSPDGSTSPQSPLNLGWEGDWETDWGTMTIRISGQLADGTYTYNQGKLWGPVSGSKMRGIWWKAPTYKPPKDEGWYEFTLAQDGMTFEGKWRYSDCAWNGDWDGTLISDTGSGPISNQKPVVLFSVLPQSPTNTDTIVLSSQSYDPEGDRLSHTWMVDGIQLAQFKNMAYAVLGGQATGSHSVMLTVMDGAGNTATSQSQFFVSSVTPLQPAPGPNRPPTAYFILSPQSPQTTSTIVASSQSSDPDGDMLTYAWTIDGMVVAQYANQPYCIYANPPVGTHTIGLQVTDSKGAAGAYQLQVQVAHALPQPAPGPQPVPGVNSPPKAYFVINPPQPEAGQDIQVTDKSSDADGDKLRYEWSLDNQPLAQYKDQSIWTWKNAQAGGHFIQVSVSDGKGGSNNYVRKIKIPGDTSPVPAPDSGKKKWKIGPFSCFIATAAYGSETASELDTLRAFRDRVLMQSQPGKLLVDLYYWMSPPLAECIAEHEVARAAVREYMLNPIVTLLQKTASYWEVEASGE